MRAACITIYDPLRPYLGRDVRIIRRRKKISALAPITHRPTICMLNGRAILRSGWRRKARDGDVIVFVQLPLGGGGGGSNPLRVVAMLAVIVLAPYAASQIAYAAFGAGLTGQAYAAAYWGARALITAGGMVLVNALIPPPRPPTPQQMQSIAAPSPTYSLQAQGNQARLGGAIPVIYGRHIVYPDFGALPYTEYAGNEQYLYQMHVIGQGEYSIESIRIEDTVVEENPIADGAPHVAGGVWEDITYQIVYDAPVTLFPTLVTTSSEVSGQEAIYTVPLGPFVANAAGTVVDAIAVDVVAPRGLFAVDTNGALLTRSISFAVEARTIDDSGAPTGTWTTIGNHTISAATTTPQRYSFRYDVAIARYEVRLTRTSAKDSGSNVGHDLLWTSLRAYHPGTNNYGKVTVLALRMRASNQLSQLSSRRINCIVTRKLPIWNGANWSAPTPTRSIAWAIADMLRAEYGARLDDSKIDLSGLLALDGVWSSRGDYYDAVHDSVETVWEALTHAARAGRALPYVQGGIVHIVRDAPQSIPVQLYSMRNIVRGSLTLDYVMPSDQSADAVDVEYFDAETWTPRTVRAALPGSTAQKPATVKLFGVTSREQAWREGMYMAACNRYRRRYVTFSSEMEGFIPSLGDLIAIAHDMPQWGQSGEIVAYDAGTLTLRLSEPLKWDVSGDHYIALRKRDGSIAGPFLVSRGTSDDEAILQQQISIPIDTGGDRERTHFAFGKANAQYILARVSSIRPRAPERVEIAAVVESSAVHIADQGIPPDHSAWQLPTDYTVPVVDGLVVRSSPSDAYDARLTWRPAPGADRYLIEAAYGTDLSDPGLVFTRLGDTAAAHFSTRAIYGAQTIFRVAAVGVTRGPWRLVFYGSSSSFMWTADDNPMWTNDSNLMWSS